MNYGFFPKSEFDRVRSSAFDLTTALPLLADMCRVNTITSIKLAGSGHLGTSLSSMDIFAYLYFVRLNVTKLGWQHEDRDLFFSSKGHDVPGLYAVLHAVGILEESVFLDLAAGGATSIEANRSDARWGNRAASLVYRSICRVKGI